MKTLNYYLSLVVVGVLLFTSCSKEESPDAGNIVPDDVAVLSLGPVLNDMINKAASKQAVGDIPACSEDAPAYAQISLTYGDADTPVDVVVAVLNDENGIFTAYDPALEIPVPAGATTVSVTLNSFLVRNDSGGSPGDVIWAAPMASSDFGSVVDQALPITWQLRAGSKTYADVPVICFDERQVNLYGYQFFDIHPQEVYNFCFFANYCNDAGRHFPAAYSLNVWLGTDNTGTLLYSDLTNSVSTEGEDPSAEPLCVALPDLAEFADNEEYIYYEATLMSWEEVYGEVDATVISGTLSREDIQSNFDGEDAVDYEHIQFGCDSENTSQFEGDVATTWMDLFVELSKDSYYNPESARIFAYSGLALYEAVVPGMPSYQSIFSQLSGESIEGDKNDLYWPASANAALAQLSARLLQDYPQPPNLTAIEQLEAAFYEDFNSSIPDEKLQRSIAYGKQVADQIYEWSTMDGYFAPCGTYIPDEEPGTWVPTPPAPAAGFCLVGGRTFVADLAENVLPVPPPPYSTDPASEFYQMNEMVYEISQNLTPEDHRIIEYWSDIPNLGVRLNGPTHLAKITVDRVREENLNLADASVLLAKEGMAVWDAIVASLYAKYTYTRVRPDIYIPNVVGHSSWDSVYPTPPHPSYPSIATGVAAAVVEILEDYFGENFTFEDTSEEGVLGTFNYDSLDGLIDNVKRSRTHSGLNYQLSVDVAEELGREVGEAVNSLNFRK